MRLLIVSVNYWSGGGCFGSTYNSIFGGMPGLEIGQVYFNVRLPAPEAPANVTRFFRIGLKQALLSPITRRWAGEEVQRRPAGEPSAEPASFADCSQGEENLIAYFRRNHWTWLRWLIYWIIARFGRWRSPQLTEFVRDFNPDAIWLDATPSLPSLAMALYLKELTGLPLTGYVYDEHYSLKRLRFSPAFWLYRFACRRLIRRVFRQAEFFYTISEAQKDYYETLFGKECRVLTRCADFSGDPPPSAPREPGAPLKLLYTGNLSNGRGETLIEIGGALRRLNLNAVLDVYTAQPVSKRQCRRLESSGPVRFRGAVPGSRIPELQREADVLVLAEGNSLSYRLAARMAFSTKIIDYLHAAKPILAVGPREMNSISYFDRHACGLTAETESEIARALTQLADGGALPRRVAEQAWQTGKKYHDAAACRASLSRRLAELANGAAPADNYSAK